MAIKLIDDVVAPLVVTAADIGTAQYAPTFNEWAAYGLAGIGYVGAWQNMGGDFVKNLGIAAFPWAAKNLYARAKTLMGIKAMPASRLGRYPAQSVVPQFGGVRLV